MMAVNLFQDLELNNNMKNMLIIIGAVFLLYACGQQGPLYLPDNTKNMQNK